MDSNYINNKKNMIIINLNIQIWSQLLINSQFIIKAIKKICQILETQINIIMKIAILNKIHKIANKFRASINKNLKIHFK
jgi:hypothetical protein